MCKFIYLTEFSFICIAGIKGKRIEVVLLKLSDKYNEVIKIVKVGLQSLI